MPLVLSHSRSALLGALLLSASLAGFAGCAQLRGPLAKKSGAVEVDEATRKLSMARLLEQSQPVEARRMYQELIASKEKQQECRHRLAIMSVNEGKFDEADEHFRQAWAAGPPTANLLNDMGYTLYMEHRLPEAEKVLNDALAIDPKHQAATNHLAIVLGQQGRFDESLAMFRRVLTEAEAQANVGYLHAQQGDIEGAKAHLSKALTLDEGLTSAAEALVQLHRHEKIRKQEQRAANPESSARDEVWIDPPLHTLDPAPALPIPAHTPPAAFAPAAYAMPIQSAVPQPHAPHPNRPQPTMPPGAAPPYAMPAPSACGVQPVTYNAPYSHVDPQAPAAHITGVQPAPQQSR